MTTKTQLIKLLEEQKGTFLSGSDIADQLGVSRTAVWKAIKSLQSDGYLIHAVTNRGYCLDTKTDTLSETVIRKYLTHSECFPVIEVFPSVTSTNNVLRERAETGAPEGSLIAAVTQTAGRGRRGRSFFSPQDAGVYFSVLLRPTLPANAATLITTAAAVAVSRAVEAIAGADPQIKWVNDVYLNEKKICGILTEASFGLETGCLDYAVLGIGINIYAPEDGYPEEIRDKAGSIFSTHRPDVRNQLIAEVMNHFFQLYPRLYEKNFLEEYRRRSCVIGRKILVMGPKDSRPAVALGIDDDFRLLVRYDDQTTAALSSGEISVKL